MTDVGIEPMLTASRGYGRFQFSAEVHAGPPVVDRAMGFDETSARVVGDVLCHHFAGVKPEFVQAGSKRFLLSELEEAGTKTDAPVAGVHGDVVDVEVVFDPPHDDQTLDALVSDRDEDPLLSDQRFVIGDHRRGNEWSAVEIDRIGSVDDTFHFVAVCRFGASDHRRMLRTAAKDRQRGVTR